MIIKYEYEDKHDLGSCAIIQEVNVDAGWIDYFEAWKAFMALRGFGYLIDYELVEKEEWKDVEDDISD